MRRLASAIVILVLAAPCAAAAQGVRSMGVFGGYTQSRQLRAHADPSGTRDGALGGAWLDVDIPGSRWSVLAEGALAMRGGTYSADTGAAGEVESDVIALTVAPSFHVDIGFVGAFVYGGPTLELPLRTRSSVDLAPAFQNPSSQGLSVTAGGGIEVRLPTAWSFRLELRHVEGLSPVYTGDQGDFKHRADEILIRVGRSRP